jgi:TRAP-type C4-dicarboxylate transport system permease small subunit
VALLAAMVILVFTNVVLRYATGTSITFVDELSRWMLVYMVFLGAILGLRDYSHLGVDTLVRKASPNLRRAMFIASHAMMMACCLFILKGTWAQVVINWNVQAASIPLTLASFYAIGLIFGVSAFVILGHQLYGAITGQTSADQLIAVKDSEEH